MGSDELVLELSHFLPVPQAEVFGAFTHADRLARWWGPEGFSISRVEFDPRPGAAYRIEMQPPDAEPFYLHGEFRVVDSPSRLAFTFVWEPPDPDDVETLVELAFSERGDSTEVELRQGEFRTQERLDLHRDGWMESLDKLERLLV